MPRIISVANVATTQARTTQLLHAEASELGTPSRCVTCQPTADTVWSRSASLQLSPQGIPTLSEQPPLLG
jgi:hypothetical protein